MEKYFAKYLPVEGEIKEGDIVDVAVYSNPIVQGFSIERRPYKNGDRLADNKKYKLFICSRDVQVGDKVYYNDSRVTPHIWSNRNELSDKDLNPYKVIGEKSPDAIWVKEGDEFDEEDLRAVLNSQTGSLK
jgi:hypothetical protein